MGTERHHPTHTGRHNPTVGRLRATGPGRGVDQETYLLGAVNKINGQFISAIDHLRNVDDIRGSFDLTADPEIEEDGLFPQVLVARMLCSPQLTEKGWEYFVNALHASENTDVLEAWFEQISKLPSPQTDNASPMTDILNLSSEFLKKVVQQNPLYQGRYPRPFFWRLGDLSQKLTDEFRGDLDDIFSETNEPMDAAMMAFFQFNDTKHDRMAWAGENGQKVDTQLAIKYDHLTRTIQDYFCYYRNRCLDTRFGLSEVDIDQVLPEDSVMLPVAVAVSFANHTDLLPAVFNALLTTNFIPGLREEAAGVIERFYLDKFNKTHSYVWERTDSNGAELYKTVSDSLEKGNDRILWSDLTGAYYSEPDLEADNLDTLLWLSNPNKFRHLRNILGSKVYTIPMTIPDVTVSISAYGEMRKDKQRDEEIQPSIDVIIHTSDACAVIIQIQPGLNYGGEKDPGRIIGIPEDLEETIKPVMANILLQVQRYVETNVFPASPVSKPEKAKPGVVKEPIVSHVVTRAERIAEYKAKPQSDKRKRIHNEVPLTEMHKRADVSVDAREFSLTLVPSEAFQKDLSDLPDQMQIRVGNALERVKHNQKMIKPLRLTNEKVKDMYSVRIGDYRIIFVRSGSGEMLITSIRPRGIAYTELSNDYAKLMAFQH